MFLNITFNFEELIAYNGSQTYNVFIRINKNTKYFPATS